MRPVITVSPCKRYIILKFFGEITVGSVLEHGPLAFEQGEVLGIKKFLYDVTEARNTDSVINNYVFAYDEVNRIINRFKGVKVVTLMAEGDNSHLFVETAMLNSGIDAKFFTDKGEAVESLLK